MKKLLNLKTLVLVLVIALAFGALAACTATDDGGKGGDAKPSPSTSPVVIPDFTFNIVDGATTIAVNQTMVSELTLYIVPYTKDDVTTYFKGVKISELLPAITGLTDQTDIQSLLFVGSDGYGSDKPALPSEHCANAYLTFLFATTENGEYVALDETSAPARLFDQTAGTGVKSIKNLANVYVNRTLFTVTDGENTYNVGVEDFEELDLKSYAYVKNDTTTNYKGYSIADVMDVFDISMTGVIEVVLVSGEFDSTLTGAMISGCVLATLIEDPENAGEYIALDDENGPVKALWNTGTKDTNCKMLETVTLTRAIV